MVRIGFAVSKLAGIKPTAFLTRFLFGVALTLTFSLVTRWAGPVIGGLFLAFPGIYPPGSSFVESQEEERKQAAGLHGTARARSLASAHAVGASAGCFGLLGFSAVVWFGLPHMSLVLTLLAATLAWIVLSVGAWALRERL